MYEGECPGKCPDHNPVNFSVREALQQKKFIVKRSKMLTI